MISDKIIEVAKSQVGQHEIPHGSNWGPQVQPFLNSVGLNGPAFWCMAFVYWVFDQAFKAQNIPNPLSKTAGVIDQLTKHLDKVVKTPLPGDIFILEVYEIIKFSRSV